MVTASPKASFDPNPHESHFQWGAARIRCSLRSAFWHLQQHSHLHDLHLSLREIWKLFKPGLDVWCCIVRLEVRLGREHFVKYKMPSELRLSCKELTILSARSERVR